MLVAQYQMVYVKRSQTWEKHNSLWPNKGNILALTRNKVGGDLVSGQLVS
jgi:hypothetical protein